MNTGFLKPLLGLNGVILGYVATRLASILLQVRVRQIGWPRNWCLRPPESQGLVQQILVEVKDLARRSERLTNQGLGDWCIFFAMHLTKLPGEMSARSANES